MHKCEQSLKWNGIKHAVSIPTSRVSLLACANKYMWIICYNYVLTFCWGREGMILWLKHYRARCSWRNMRFLLLHRKIRMCLPKHLISWLFSTTGSTLTFSLSSIHLFSLLSNFLLLGKTTNHFPNRVLITLPKVIINSKGATLYS